MTRPVAVCGSPDAGGTNSGHIVLDRGADFGTTGNRVSNLFKASRISCSFVEFFYDTF